MDKIHKNTVIRVENRSYFVPEISKGHAAPFEDEKEESTSIKSKQLTKHGNIYSDEPSCKPLPCRESPAPSETHQSSIPKGPGHSNQIRYNAFIHIPVDDKEFLRNLNDFNARIRANSPKLQEFIFNKKHHLTVLVLRLETEQDERKAKEAMEQIGARIRSSDIFQSPSSSTSAKMQLYSPKINFFGKETDCHAVFADIQQYSGDFKKLEAVGHIAIDEMVSNGLIAPKDLSHIEYDEKKKQYSVEHFHISLLRSNKRLGKMNIRPVWDAIYSFEFGKIDFNELYLSRMDATYSVIAKVSL